MVTEQEKMIGNALDLSMRWKEGYEGIKVYNLKG